MTRYDLTFQDVIDEYNRLKKIKPEYCQAQVSDHLCANKLYKDGYCRKHFKMFND